MQTQLNLFDAPTPSQVGVPHSSWRPAQLDVFLETRALDRQGGGTFVADAPTGCGKSAVATALGSEAPVLVLVKTLGLLDQYVEEYGFVGVKGRQEYPCAHPEKRARWSSKYNRVPTAFDCHYEKMTDCPRHDDCPYIFAKHRALRAMRAVVTYRYAAFSIPMQKRGGVVVLDEAHAAPTELFGLQEFALRESDRRNFGLPPFPPFRGYDEKGDILSLLARHHLRDWLAECAAALDGWQDGLDLDDAEAGKLQRRCKRALDSLEKSNWFLQAGPELFWTRGRLVPGVRLKSLDARPVAKRILRRKRTRLLMSATVGDPKPLVAELGIDDHAYRCYANPVPVGARPVFDLGFERMTKRNLDARPDLHRLQADAIWTWLRGVDPSWRGLVLTSSYGKIKELKRHLGPRLDDRLFRSDARGVTARIAAFVRDPRPGLVTVDTMQGWGHGLDLRGDLGRFVVVAGVPFDNPVDPYTRARRRMTNGDRFYWWSAYTSVPQACGRVSRGERDARGEWLENWACLADGSTTSPKALKHYPSWFQEALK